MPEIIRPNPPMPLNGSKEEIAKRPWCHRIYVPVVYGEQVTAPGIGSGVQMKTDLTLTKCLGGQCALWDEGEKKCGDLVQAQSLKKIAQHYDKQEKALTFVDSGT